MTLVHVNLCMHILCFALSSYSNPFPVTRIQVLNSVTDLSRHTLSSLHSKRSREVHIIHRKKPASSWYRSAHIRMRMSVGFLEPLVIMKRANIMFNIFLFLNQFPWKYRTDSIQFTGYIVSIINKSSFPLRIFLNSKYK